MRDDERVILELVKLRSRLPGDGDEEWLDAERMGIGWRRYGYDWDKRERIDYGEEGRFHVYVDCSDVFAWATSDGEEVTLETLPILKQTMDDIVEVWKTEEEFSEAREKIERVARLLYCARVREMRPQGAMYKYLPEKLWPLFDAAGPVRETGFGNPHPQPEAAS